MSLGMSFARRRMMAAPGGIAADPILNNNSWEVISEVATAGEGANFWAVGDRKEIILNGTVGHLSLSNFSVYAFILGFNHNEAIEGSGRIHFQLAKNALSGGKSIAFCDSYYGSGPNNNTSGYFWMNTRATSSGGWASSHMRNTICGTRLTSYSGTVIGVIPEDLRAVLKTVTKYTDNKGDGSPAESEVTATTDYFFLLSEYEVLGTNTYFSRNTAANPYEKNKQAVYEYYSSGGSRAAYRHDNQGTYANWWSRSPNKQYGQYFVAITYNGSASYINSVEYASNSLGFAPGFCV